MGFLVSPGVEVNEIDLTDIVPAVSTSIGGYAGFFRWGPTGRLVTVGSEKELAQAFGTPTKGTGGEIERSFFTAASFLKYGNNLKISKAAVEDSTTAIPSDQIGASGALNHVDSTYKINGPEDLFGDLLDDLRTDDIRVTARYTGKIADGLTVLFITSTTSGAAKNSYGINLQYEPGSTDWALSLRKPLVGSEPNDEVAVVVIDSSGNFSGKAGTVLEQMEGLSMITNAKNQYGESNYWVDYVNSNSSYICGVPFTGDPVLEADWELPPVYTSLTGNLVSNYIAQLWGGVDGTGDGQDIVNALELFEDSETVDVNLLFAHSFSTVSPTETIDDEIVRIVSSRKDCMGFISAPLTMATMTSNAAKKEELLDKFSGINSNSYLVFDSSPAYVYNRYSDSYLWIPLSGHMAGLCASTDEVADPWFSPAGFNRGNLLGVTKLAYNPTQADRDDIYQQRINPVVSFPGRGIVLYGDRTGLAKPSAFDRINVRRLFITLEKAISTAAKFQLFELNDEFTRASFRNAVEPYLRGIQGRRGITDFRVVCDGRNNTGEVIDSNRFVADIYIKPARSINFITLNFIATRTGVAFEELIGQ